MTSSRPNRFKRIVRWLLGHYGKPTTGLYGLATVLKSIARHYVKLPEEEIAGLRAICLRIAVKQSGLTKKNRDRLRPFDDPQSSRSPDHVARSFDAAGPARPTTVVPGSHGGPDRRGHRDPADGTDTNQ